MDDGSRFETVARLEDLPPGQARSFRLASGRPIILARLDDGVHAIENRCSHDGGALGEGPLAGDQITCPRHGARFDLTTGQPRCLPALVPIRVFATRIQGDEVQVDPGEPAS